MLSYCAVAMSAMKSLEAKLARIERALASVAPEIKYCDLDLSTTNSPSANGSSGHMTAIAAGTAVNTRVGLRVIVKRVELHFYFNYTSSILSVTSETPAYRVYIVQDRQEIQDNSAITISDFVDNAALPITQLRNVSSFQRFKVLFDSGPQIVFTGVPGTGVPNDVMVSPFKVQVHFKSPPLNIATSFNGTASTDIQSNGIWLLVCNNMTGAAGSAVFDYSAVTRVAFTDA